MKQFLSMVHKLKINWPHFIFGIFLALTGFLLYSNLGRDGLFDWDEGIYSELGRQVVVTGNLFSPSWNQSVWLEKPPGIAWLAGLGIAIFGPTSFGARSLMPLVALYVLFIVYRLGSHLGGWRQGYLASGLLLSLSLFLGRTRGVNTDMALLATISTTILFLIKNRPAWWVAVAIFCGVWFKGVAGLLTVIIALPLFLTKSKKYLVSLFVISSLLIIPWHLYSYAVYGSEFTTPYFFEQVFRRATAQIEFHFESRWYYFKYLYDNLGLGIILVAALGVVTTLRRFLTQPKKSMLEFTLIWWALVPLALFTLAKTRLFWYILPIYPSIALLVSQSICQIAPTLNRGVITILSVGVMVQSLFMAANSVELSKRYSPLPDRLLVAETLRTHNRQVLHILVPPSERLSEALLPAVAKLSSSFRYGGMPAVVYYYAGPVKFYYDVDEFRAFWNESPAPLAMISVEDRDLVPPPYHEVATFKTYLGIQKGVYALR